MDEFTFPTVPDGQCKLAPFPPPWFVAAVAEEEEDDGSSGGAPWGRDEKMDMLWEDFNEELARAPPVCPLSPLSKRGGLMTMTMMEAEWFYSDGNCDGDDGGVIETRKRTGRHMVVRRRRWSLLLMLRLLKKLFLVKKSRNGRTAPI